VIPSQGTTNKENQNLMISKVSCFASFWTPSFFIINCLEINGAQGRNRTTDTMIFSHVLYQLSYLGMAAIADRIS
jgi:hypothetical protein